MFESYGIAKASDVPLHFERRRHIVGGSVHLGDHQLRLVLELLVQYRTEQCTHSSRVIEHN